jgi:hypothetical protein
LGYHAAQRRTRAAALALTRGARGGFTDGFDGAIVRLRWRPGARSAARSALQTAFAFGAKILPVIAQIFPCSAQKISLFRRKISLLIFRA